MVELIVCGGLAVVGRGIWRWINHDGPARLVAGLTAVAHKDEVRRRDARRVLAATQYLRGSRPDSGEPSGPSSVRSLLPARTRRRPDAGTPKSSPGAEAA
ncbi:hypothetical protein [Nocardia brevicatena]|uniref:hypothetical protein n=1 Tax=Nocardia brevicatena TaxID=37327 RepID=UPI00059437FE|nr:hypothetical protein [Nocardia brevicatena]